MKARDNNQLLRVKEMLLINLSFVEHIQDKMERAYKDPKSVTPNAEHEARNLFECMKSLEEAISSLEEAIS